MKTFYAAGIIMLIALIAAVAVSGNIGITPERISPKDRIGLNQILLTADSVEILLKDARLATVSDTNSMDPTLDEESILIETAPEDKSDIIEGDIITYYKDNRVIVHRVIDIGVDEEGWYAITKGDNNGIDDGKVRFGDIRGIIVGIFY